MDSNAYNIRDKVCARVSKDIDAVKLTKDENRSYTHDDETLFLQQINRKLEQQLNEYASSGTKKLMLETANELTKLKALVLITWSRVLKAEKNEGSKEICKNKKGRGQSTPHRDKRRRERRGRPPKCGTSCNNWQQ